MHTHTPQPPDPGTPHLPNELPRIQLNWEAVPTYPGIVHHGYHAEWNEYDFYVVETWVRKPIKLDFSESVPAPSWKIESRLANVPTGFYPTDTTYPSAALAMSQCEHFLFLCLRDRLIHD